MRFQEMLCLFLRERTGPMKRLPKPVEVIFGDFLPLDDGQETSTQRVYLDHCLSL